MTLLVAHTECKTWLSLQTKVENGQLDLSDDAAQILDGIVENCNDINEAYTQTMRTLNHYNTDVNDVLYGSDSDRIALKNAYNKKTPVKLGKSNARAQKVKSNTQGQGGGLLGLLAAL